MHLAHEAYDNLLHFTFCLTLEIVSGNVNPCVSHTRYASMTRNMTGQYFINSVIALKQQLIIPASNLSTSNSAINPPNSRKTFFHSIPVCGVWHINIPGRELQDIPGGAHSAVWVGFNLLEVRRQAIVGVLWSRRNVQLQLGCGDIHRGQ